MAIDRRGLGRMALALWAAQLWGAPVPARAQPQPGGGRSAIRALGVFSLLADAIDVTVNDRPVTDTRIAGGRHESIAVPKIGFDALVLREVRAVAAARLAGTELALFGASSLLSGAEQREIAAGAHRAELPAWIVQVIEQKKFSHVLLATRARADAALRTDENSTIGRGMVEGIGYYVDPTYQVRNTTTGALADGALGAYVLVDLVLLDVVQGQVVRSATIRRQDLLAARESRAEVDPWNWLTPTERAEWLRGMLTRELRRHLDALFSPG